MTLIESAHSRFVFGRRVRVLAERIADCLPQVSSVLDVGCGDGSIAFLVGERRPELEITGIDVLVREHTKIPVAEFDGLTIPLPDRSVDAVMFVDVLHHTEDPTLLLREAARVARKAILIKDHNREGLLAATTLRFMDWVGNAHHGVALPYNYWSRAQWRAAFEELKLSVQFADEDLGLYGFPATVVFDRSLHFLVQLGVGSRS